MDGVSGAAAEAFVLREGDRIAMRSKQSFKLRKGDKLIMRTGGGSGFGAPAQRSSEMVAMDAAQGLAGGLS